VTLDLLVGEQVARELLTEKMKRSSATVGRRPAVKDPPGYHKASLSTDSLFPLLSFQETTRVLTQAAVEVWSIVSKD
jgi:hypothetical protein